MANPPPSHYPHIGEFGEELVTQWLQSHGWLILQRRYSCRWGEIDIIAQSPDSTLAFVEVKTRSPGNWDSWGKSAITLKKQAKIGRTAGLFLATYPEKADYTCRFDVAIVYCLKLSQQHRQAIDLQPALASLSTEGYIFQLQEYIPAAFDLVIDEC